MIYIKRSPVAPVPQVKENPDAGKPSCLVRPYDLRIYTVSRGTDCEIPPSLFGNISGKVIGFLTAQ